MCCKCLSRWFPGPSELGVGCTCGLGLLGMALMGVLVSGIMFAVDTGKAGRYANATCTVAVAKLRDAPRASLSSDDDCGRNRSKYAPPGAYYWPQVASWDVTYDATPWGPVNETSTIFDLPFSACIELLPRQRLGLHHVGDRTVCYFDTTNPAEVQWADPAATAGAWLAGLIASACILLVVVGTCRLCMVCKPWESTSDRSERLALLAGHR